MLQIVQPVLGILRLTNVNLTLIQRFDVESMLNRRCFNVVCLLGYQSNVVQLEQGTALALSVEKLLWWRWWPKDIPS